MAALSSTTDNLIYSFQFVKVTSVKHIRSTKSTLCFTRSNYVHIAIIIITFSWPKLLLVQWPVLTENSTFKLPLSFGRWKDIFWVDCSLQLLKCFFNNNLFAFESNTLYKLDFKIKNSNFIILLKFLARKISNKTYFFVVKANNRLRDDLSLQKSEKHLYAAQKLNLNFSNVLQCGNYL